MGMKSRRKGRSFEQLIATAYRRTWPTATVRRSLQAHQPYEPDVVVEDHQLASRLWTECQHADDPTPLAKLDQAERDIVKAVERNVGGNALAWPEHYAQWLPLVVWRRTRCADVHASTRVWVLAELTGLQTPPLTCRDLIVTVNFDHLLISLKAA